MPDGLLQCSDCFRNTAYDPARFQQIVRAVVGDRYSEAMVVVCGSVLGDIGVRGGTVTSQYHHILLLQSLKEYLK